MEKAVAEQNHGPKYFLNIEGAEYQWDEPTITTEQIAEVGGWDVSQGVIEVDKDNNERTLSPGEVVELKPGKGFGKKHKWKRG
ncbi:multiubiquitin domain-containing protein [Lentisalinibacter salinarum]|uniref:multiubiquitin domain-containing protein n=1 Tax=Lentisalinibacter salinarum TaxID=2992239 RepID=UPI003867EDF7